MAQAAVPVLAGISAVSSLAGGFAQARGLDAQRQAAEYQAKNLRLQAKQVGAENARDLNETLSTIDAIRSYRNVSIDSPTAMVIERTRKTRAQDVDNAQRLEIMQGVTDARYQAKMAKKAKPFAILSGIGGAASSLASGFASGGGGGG